ncbi:MAG: glycosyltransferase family 4 protein [Thermoplasmata archaeon]
MKKVKIIGTSFLRNEGGVSDMNNIFFNYISKYISVDKIDIMNEARNRFGNVNNTLARNLELLFLRHLIHDENIHVMHTLDLCNTIPFFDISSTARSKIITVHDFYPFIHSGNIHLINRLDNFFKRRCYKYISSYDHIFARTEEIAKILTQNFNIDFKKISIQGPIIENIYSPIERFRKHEKIRIGYINSFSWNKAPMLKAFINFIKGYKNEDIELIIYGKNFPFEDLIHDDKRIKYLGFLPDSQFIETLSSFDVYLSTSTHEGFSIPIAKAKAMKIPVLCFDGDLPNITKRNTCLWNTETLSDIIEKREWEKINLDEAYKDIIGLRPEHIVKETLNIYDKIFS